MSIEAQNAVNLFRMLVNAIKPLHEELSPHRPLWISQELTQAMDRLAIAIMEKYRLNAEKQTVFGIIPRVSMLKYEQIRSLSFQTMGELMGVKIQLYKTRTREYDRYGMEFRELVDFYEPQYSVFDALRFVNAELVLEIRPLGPVQVSQVKSDRITPEVRNAFDLFTKIAKAIEVEQKEFYTDDDSCSSLQKAEAITEAMDRLAIAIIKKYDLRYECAPLPALVPRVSKTNPAQLESLRFRTINDLMDAKVQLLERRDLEEEEGFRLVYISQLSVRESLNLARSGIARLFGTGQVLWGKSCSLIAVEAKLAK